MVRYSSTYDSLVVIFSGHSPDLLRQDHVVQVSLSSIFIAVNCFSLSGGLGCEVGGLDNIKPDLL